MCSGFRGVAWLTDVIRQVHTAANGWSTGVGAGDGVKLAGRIEATTVPSDTCGLTEPSSRLRDYLASGFRHQLFPADSNDQVARPCPE
jgi:hypothetical protein